MKDRSKAKNRTSTNPVTGDLIKTRPTSDAYRNNYDAIFKKPKKTND